MQPYVPAGYMTAQQAAALLGITLSGLRDHVHRGRLTRAGGTPRRPYYDRDDILALATGRPDRFPAMFAAARAATDAA